MPVLCEAGLSSGDGTMTIPADIIVPSKSQPSICIGICTSTSVADGVTLRPSPEDVANRLFADLNPKMRAWALERWTPHPIAFRFQPVKLDSFWSQQWRASVIWCRRAPNPGEAHQRRAAERLGAKWAELDSGHYPMLSVPTELTSLLTAG